MSTFHAVVWMDHQNAHVLMFDREHVQAERIQSRSTHSHQGKHADTKSYFAEISHGLAEVHEVLLTGPGTARTEFRTWCDAQPKGAPMPSSTAWPVTTRQTPNWWRWGVSTF